MRTVSTNRSAGATPNTGTLNSRDGHYAHNTSTSSGSHTLEVDRISRENVLHDHSTHVETAEVHDDSSYSGSRSLRDHERQAPQVANHTYREADDHVEQDPAKGAHDESNYSYYHSDYDYESNQQSANQNANDNDDNISHDSYNLDSRDSLERELDDESKGSRELLETVLHIDEEELMKELEEEKRLQDEREHNGDGVVRKSQSEECGLVRGVESVDENDIENVHIVSVQAEPEQEKRVEIQIVEKLESTKVVEKVERTRVIQKMQTYDKSEAEKVSDLEEVKVETEAPDTELEVQTEEAVNSSVDDDVNSNDTSQDGRDEEEEDNIRESLVDIPAINGKDNNDEIPYLLHRRHLKKAWRGDSEGAVPPPPAPLTGLARTPSPTRPVGGQFPSPLTKDQEKTQMDKIKYGLQSPIISPAKAPKSPRDKSPVGKRAFEYVPKSKLPPKDSYSSKDDSVSPQLEKEIMKRMREKAEEDRMKKEKGMMRLSGLVTAELEQKKLEQGEDAIGVAGLAESPSSESEPETPEHDHLDIEDDVNRVLSECGQEVDDSSEVSSVSDGMFEDRVIISTEAREELHEVSREIDQFVSRAEEMDVGKENVDPQQSEKTPTAPVMVTLGDEDSTPEMDLPPPPPLPPIIQQDTLSSPEFTPPQAGASGFSFEVLPIPDIVVRAATPVQLSSSSEEEIRVPRPKPAVPPKPARKQRVAERESSSDSDLPPPPPPPPIDIESDSAGEVEMPDASDFGDVHQILQCERDAKPYSSPLTGHEDLPAPPPHDISSEESGTDGEMEFDMADVAEALKAEVATANPFHVPISGETVFAAPPDHDISSESDVEHPDLEESFGAHYLLQQQAEANPYTVPVPHDHKAPGSPEHDISSESDVEGPGQHDYEDAHGLLASEAMARPYSIPIAADAELPAPPGHDISSESDDEVHEVEDFPDAAEILESAALANPYSVPLPSGAKRQITLDSSSGSEGGAPQEEDLPDAADILEADLIDGDRASFGEGDADLPPPPPPPPIDYIKSYSPEDGEESPTGPMPEFRHPTDEFYHKLELAHLEQLPDDTGPLPEFIHPTEEFYKQLGAANPVTSISMRAPYEHTEDDQFYSSSSTSSEDEGPREGHDEGDALAALEGLESKGAESDSSSGSEGANAEFVPVAARHQLSRQHVGYGRPPQTAPHQLQRHLGEQAGKLVGQVFTNPGADSSEVFGNPYAESFSGPQNGSQQFKSHQSKSGEKS